MTLAPGALFRIVMETKRVFCKSPHGMNNDYLKGKTAVITGASKGLGKAMALALASRGASIALISRNLDLLSAVAKEIRSSGGQAEPFKADVTDEAQVAALAKAVVAKFGKPQILINNAGINLRKSVTDFTLAEWRQVIDTNLTSVFLMCRAFVPHMKGQGYGRILNMTSIMSHVAIAGRTAYAASKRALLGFIKALALELASEKITVNGISPGPFATELNKPILDNPELNTQFISKIPIGRWGKVEEVGEMAAYLCAEEAGFITGTDILIDGGWTAQ
jgi:NAD(P)-dependent dehydrogenase (short-subunit alcohol dehydrogenase family)